MKRIDIVVALALLSVLTLSCGRTCDVRPTGEGTDRAAFLFPDYQEVTIPCNIAPLNFYYTDPAGRKFVTSFSAGSFSTTLKGREIVWKPAKGFSLRNTVPSWKKQSGLFLKTARSPRRTMHRWWN